MSHPEVRSVDRIAEAQQVHLAGESPQTFQKALVQAFPLN